LVRRAAVVLFIACTLTLAGPALAKPYAMAISIGAGPLPASLQALERQSGIELLFDHSVVSELESPPVQGTLTPEEALQRLLAATDLSARRAESGAWIVERPVVDAFEAADHYAFHGLLLTLLA